MTTEELVVFLCLLAIVGAAVVIILTWQFYKEGRIFKDDD